MSDEPTDELHADAVEGGNYDVIRDRLSRLGRQLREATGALDERRRATFGSTELVVLGNARVRTENNCLPVDIVAPHGGLLFGYNVFLGLKKRTVPEDVFSLQLFERGEEGYSFHPAAEDGRLAFLQDPTFLREFDELYQYYKDARLIQLRLTGGKLLAVFQIGATARDVRVLRWAVEPTGAVRYIDNRGERDHVYPPTHDFEWVETTRADHVLGRHPHVNILDTVFVETVGGDLTVKVEDNTSDGEGIYSEPVEDRDQSLDDARILYAKRATLILLSIKPRGEPTRFLVYNTNTRQVDRIDAIGSSCVSLPEDHGILFPGGFVLRTGEVRVFERDVRDLEFVRAIHSPNGEDVLYVFHRRGDGLYKLYPYNLIAKDISQPITAHGWSLFPDGTLVVLLATAEPTRVHPVQIWQTPFVSDEIHEGAPNDGSLIARIGNRDLVRGISDALTLARIIDDQRPTRELYEELVVACTRALDAYYWLGEPEIGLQATIDSIRGTAERIIDEFVKVQELRRRAVQVLTDAQRRHDALLTDLRPDYFDAISAFLDAMTTLRKHRGELITLRETRYIDASALDALEAQTIERFDAVSQATVTFLLGGDALTPLTERMAAVEASLPQLGKALELDAPSEELDRVTEGVNLLAEVVAGLEVEDPTVKTQLIDGISEVVGAANRVRALLEQRRRRLRSAEGAAEFNAQFKLFGQSIASALAMCDTPEACDDGLSRMLLQLEELEARFSEFDDFLPQLAEKRDEVVQAFGSRKQTLLDERQRRVDNLLAAAERILTGVQRRAGSFASEDELNGWYASDPMVMKLRQLADQLAQLGDSVRADELRSRLLAARQNALRGLRDKLELFEGGDDLIRLGRHRFSYNTQPIELTLVPRDGGLALHLMGTDFYEPIEDEDFLATRSYWDQTVVSEDASTYRGEYLAASILFAAERGEGGLSIDTLEAEMLVEADLLARVRAWTAERFDEGYDRGIHDVDAAHILKRLLALRRTADLLRFSARARCAAALFVALADDLPLDRWRSAATALVRLRDQLGPTPQLQAWLGARADAIAAWFDAHPLLDDVPVDEAARYLLELLARGGEFVFAQPADALRTALWRWAEDHGGASALDGVLRELPEAERFQLLLAHTAALSRGADDDAVAVEAATLAFVEGKLSVHVSGGDNRGTVEGLLGRHPRVEDGTLHLALDRFEARLRRFVDERVPGFRAYREARRELLVRHRRRLRLDELEPRVMTSFVRNQLINDVYLHLVGDNFAKQLGAAGDSKRTDQSGLLLLISPPGYGKTTLMEYIASRLGLTFVKVNGPSLGHEVTSLDPDEAGNATARQEVDKVNLALEMGNNVMLYLDDIQHCHPEFLQKFISLCDGQRRIEGIWRGRTRTYDLRGKKFAVVMAGNPYTETGEKFQIPDMLANRADTYNLGDILGETQDKFALSFIENALTSNPVLAPLASRPQKDVYALVRMARGEEVSRAELAHDYSAIELGEITSTLQHLFRCQRVLLQVNAEYIRSASMEDRYRTEPRFQLQGSYRNMAKLAEKVMPAMTEAEVEALIGDHYQGESQTLTTGAESNLLKLGELRGTLDPGQAARWEQIKSEFRRLQLMGGDDDPASKISGVITGVTQAVGALGERLTDRAVEGELVQLRGAIEQLGSRLPTGPDLGPVRAALGAARDEASGARGTLDEVVAQLRAIQALLREGATLPARQAPAPAPVPPVPHPAQAPTPAGAPPSPPPAPSLEETRRRMAAQVEAGLGHRRAELPDDPDPTLAGALQVIELLTVAMSSAARGRMTEDAHAELVSEVRRAVAGAVGELAGR